MSNRPSLSLDVALGFHSLLAEEGQRRGEGLAPSRAKSDAAALECRTDEYLPSEIINNGRPASAKVEVQLSSEQPTNQPGSNKSVLKRCKGNMGLSGCIS